MVTSLTHDSTLNNTAYTDRSHCEFMQNKIKRRRWRRLRRWEKTFALNIFNPRKCWKLLSTISLHFPRSAFFFVRFNSVSFLFTNENIFILIAKTQAQGMVFMNNFSICTTFMLDSGRKKNKLLHFVLPKMSHSHPPSTINLLLRVIFSLFSLFSENEFGKKKSTAIVFANAATQTQISFPATRINYSIWKFFYSILLRGGRDKTAKKRNAKYIQFERKRNGTKKMFSTIKFLSTTKNIESICNRTNNRCNYWKLIENEYVILYVQGKERMRRALRKWNGKRTHNDEKWGRKIEKVKR